ncbi:protein 15056 precursor [Sigmodon hispidus]
MAVPQGCKQEETEWKDSMHRGGTFINNYEYHYCDSLRSVCLRRKTNCTRMPGLCPGRSFCCVRTMT